MRTRKQIEALLQPKFDDRRLESYPPPSHYRDEIIIELLLDIRDCLSKISRPKVSEEFVEKWASVFFGQHNNIQSEEIAMGQVEKMLKEASVEIE